MNSVELVIFDLAGTTVEDRGEVPAAFTGALAELGNPLLKRPAPAAPRIPAPTCCS
jgi:hypothetical protein